MDELSRKAMILHLVRELRKANSFCGETHIQKSAYVMHILFNTFNDYEFILYKYGPYSFDLNSELASMLADGFLELELSQHYGPKFNSGQSAEFLDRNIETSELFLKQLQFVSKELGMKGVKDLEPIATSLMFESEVDNETALIELLIEKKPHIDHKKAHWAICEVKKLRKKAAKIA